MTMSAVTRCPRKRVNSSRIRRGDHAAPRGRLRHIDLSREQRGKRALAADRLDTRELLRELTLDPTKDYQTRGRPPGPLQRSPDSKRVTRSCSRPCRIDRSEPPSVRPQRLRRQQARAPHYSSRQPGDVQVGEHRKGAAQRQSACVPFSHERHGRAKHSGPLVPTACRSERPEPPGCKSPSRASRRRPLRGRGSAG